VVVEAVDRHGAPAVLLVGPDNGLLPPVVHAIGAFGRAVEIDRPGRAAPGASTFAGRDVLAAVAADLCNGAALGELGPAIDPGGLVELSDRPASVAPDGTVAGRVQWVDRFGNVQLNVAGALVAGWARGAEVTVAGLPEVPVVIVAAYQEIPDGVVGLLVDSEGWVSLAANRSPAATALGLSEGDPVRLRPPASRQTRCRVPTE
jgi:hypothetical protein